jgi:hypothetical protein
MPYLNCPHCGLTLPVTRAGDLIEECPRCMAREKRSVELFVSAEPRGTEDPAAEGASSPS